MPRYCLIVEPIPLVARDLALTAQERYGLTPVITGSAAEALDWLDAPQTAPFTLALALVHPGPNVASDSTLWHCLNDMCARVVLLGSEAAPQAGAAQTLPVLAWPFTTEHVVNLFDTLGLRDTPPGPSPCRP